MNVFLQLGIGLGIVALLVWLCVLLRKQKRLPGGVYAGILTASCVALLVYGLLKTEPEKKEVVSSLTPLEWMSFAYSFAEEGAYEEASELLEEYCRQYGYDEGCSLFMARLYALQGKYEEASGIYQSLQTGSYGADMAQEYEYVAQKIGIADDVAAMIRFLEKNGKNPAEYGYAAEIVERAEQAASITQEMIFDAVFSAVTETYDTEQFEKVTANVLLAGELYDTYAGYGTEKLGEAETAEIKEVRKALNKLKTKEDGAFHAGCVREALLGLNLLLGDYKAIAETMDASATYSELVIASELYMGGILADKDFSQTYLAAYGAGAETVGDQIRAVYTAEKKNLEDAEAEELESVVKYWKIGLKYPALTRMKNALEAIAEEKKAASETSKVFLALAKIEHFYENEKNRTGNITEAVSTGYASEDTAYSSAMSKIYEIIHNNENTAEVMKVPGYVEEALEHAMPSKLQELIPSAEEGLDLYALTEEALLWQEDRAEQKEEKPEASVKKEFSQVFVEYVSEIKSTIGIGLIDTDAFETVKARVTVSSKYAKNSEELKRLLSVYDCGLEITDFTIEKVKHEGIRTYLICDVSGSMDSSISDLRDAVIRYINGKGKNEQIALSTFSSFLNGTVSFGSEDSELISFAESMYASGGTAIYNSLMEIMRGLDDSQNSNNVIILMTDGEDGYRASYEMIETELAQLAEEKNVTVYTLGLGYVDTDYLTAIAESGRGDFVYVSDSTSLDNFYQLLHSQVDNQYILTYQAIDTLTGTDRTLELKLLKDNVSDVKSYSILDEAGDSEGGDSLRPAWVNISGLGVRSVYKGMQEIQNTLLGSGFTPDGRALLRLLGDKDYTIELSYVDEKTYHFKVPADMAVGTYDAEISIAGKKTVLRDAFCVIDAEQETMIAFGPYVFSAAKCTDHGNGSVTLSGNVVLNDWLNFKGDIEIKGDWNTSAAIRVVDRAGSYVAFDAANAVGLGKYLADNGMTMDVPALNEFELYYDANHLYDFEEYQVADIRTSFLQLKQLLDFDSPFIKLYPDRIELEYSNIKPHFPFQDLILKPKTEKFEVKCKGSAILNQQNFGMLIQVTSEGENKNYKQVDLFQAPVYLNMDDIELSIDTFKEEYSFGGIVNLGFLDTGIGAKVTFKGFIPDEFLLILDKDVSVTMGGVPLTFGKFKFGAEDLAPALQKRNLKLLKIAGGLDIAAAKVSEYFPKLVKFVGDISLFSMPDTEMKLDLQPLGFSAEAKLKFLETIQLLKAQVNIGSFEYSNELLELDAATVSGLRAALSAGFNWETEDCKVDISATGELDALNRFFGIQVKDARVLVDVKWWLFSKSIEKEADALLGLYFTEEWEPQFMLILSSYDKTGKREKLCLYIDKNGKTGKANSMQKIR